MLQLLILLAFLFSSSVHGFRNGFSLVSRQKLFRLASSVEDVPSDVPSPSAESEAPTVTVSLTESSKETFLKGKNINRIDVGENILNLEKKNPTENPASSAMLNGVWELVSTGAISSLGLVLFQVVKSLPGSIVDADDIILTISQGVATARSKFQVGTLKVDISVASELMAESPIRLKETYSSATLGSIDLPKRDGISRSLFVTYLDEDLLIVRDKFGSADVLKRMEKQFQASTEVSATMGSGEDGSPGV